MDLVGGSNFSSPPFLVDDGCFKPTAPKSYQKRGIQSRAFDLTLYWF